MIAGNDKKERMRCINFKDCKNNAIQNGLCQSCIDDECHGEDSGSGNNF